MRQAGLSACIAVHIEKTSRVHIIIDNVSRRGSYVVCRDNLIPFLIPFFLHRYYIFISMDATQTKMDLDLFNDLLFLSQLVDGDSLVSTLNLRAVRLIAQPPSGKITKRT